MPIPDAVQAKPHPRYNRTAEKPAVSRPNTATRPHDTTGVFFSDIAVRLFDTGGPTLGESLDSWRARLQQQQQTTTGSGQEEKAPVPRAPELRVPLEGGGDAVSSGPAPSPPEDGDAARLFQEQVSSSAGLDALTRGNPGALEEVQRAINANARLSPDAALGGTENRRELARLVTMAADLGEVVVSSMIRRRTACRFCEFGVVRCVL